MPKIVIELSEDDMNQLRKKTDHMLVSLEELAKNYLICHIRKNCMITKWGLLIDLGKGIDDYFDRRLNDE